jgi:transaldolase
VQKSGLTFRRQVDRLPPDAVLAEIDEKVDFDRLERVLMEEGIAKFADPQKALLRLLAERRAALIG